MLQVQASLSKNFIEKRRSLKVTCCEYFSHFIILVLLVYGHSLAEVTYHPAEHYSSLKIVIPPVSNDDYLNLLQGPIPTLNLDAYVGLSRYINPSGEQSSDFEQFSFIPDFDNLLYLGTVHFAPDSEQTYSLIDYLNSTYLSFNTLKHRVHSSESKAVDYILNHLEERTLVLIVVQRASIEGVGYKLRLNYTTLPNTNQIVNDVALGLDTDYQKYFFSSFLTFKDAVDNWVYNYTGISEAVVPNSTTSCAKPSLVYTPFPTPAYDQNIFYPSIGFLLGLALTMSTLYPVSRLIKTVVEEKESRMKELMEIMGLRPWAHNLSWSLTAFVLFFFIALTSTWISTASFFPNSSSGLVFAYFFLFCVSEIPFCFIVSVFFNKAKIAAIVGPVALFAALLPRFIFINTNSYEEAPNKYLASLLSPSAFAFGADILSEYEYSGEGVHFYNMNEGAYSFIGCLRMMLLDIFLYSCLAWYLSEAVPSEYGARRHPLFIFNSSYWMGGGGLLAWLCCRKPGYGTAELSEEELAAVTELPKGANSAAQSDSEEKKQTGEHSIASSHIELLDDSSDVRVMVSCLRKRYADGKLAVKKLSFAMVEGQITCLLGHNGSGKSTTISMLTGLVSPTAGDGIVWGHRLTSEMPAIRQITGVCPQQNVLFATLTVKEHLAFFGKTKGLYGRKLSAAIKDTLTEVGLSEKADVLSEALSGGMKRKLCLAMALIGNPKFILLDEPTSGMDPYSRRSTWELLQRNKAGRTILLTTHFMDEADILADRILIVSEGKLQCSGTSLFLKNSFGAGYVLSLAKADTSLPSEPIANFVKSIIPQATVTSAVAGEVEINLPISTSGMFSDLFEQLQGRVTEFGISGYGISITTLEQIFMTLATMQRNKKLAGLDDDAIEDQDHVKQTYFFREVAHLIAQCFRLFGSGVSKVYAQRRPSYCPDPVSLPVNDNFVFSASPGIEMAQRSQVEAKDSSNFGALEVVEMGDELNLCSEAIVGSPPLTPPGDHLRSPHAADKLGSRVDLLGSCVTSSIPVEANRAKLKADHFEDIEGGGTARQYTQGTLHVQMKELIGKRLTIQSRDANGFFFQIIFPALQILLILAILTIDINPAGGSLELDAGTYKRVDERPATLYSPGVNNSLDIAIDALDIDVLLNNTNLFNISLLANFTNTSLNNFTNFSFPDLPEFLFYSEDILSSVRQDVFNISDTLNSSDLSEYLLRSNDDSEGFRMGSYVFNDTIAVVVTIDWDWVRQNNGDLIANAEAIIELLNEVGISPFRLNAPTRSLYDVKDNSQSLDEAVARIFENNLFDVEIFRKSLSNSAEELDSCNVTKFLAAAFEKYHNHLSSGYDSHNMRRLVQNTLLLYGGKAESPMVSFDTALYDKATDLLTLTQLKLVFDDAEDPTTEEFALGDVFIPSNSISAIFPEGIQSYEAILPSVLTAMHNSSSAHAAAIFDGEVLRSLFDECGRAERGVDGGSADYKSVEYSAENHPLPLTAQQSLTIQVILSIFASLLMLIPLCYLPSSFVTFIVRESVSKSKHLQIVSSVSPYVYWTATYIYDVMLFVILILCAFIALLSYGQNASEAFMGTVESTFALFFLLLTYGASVIPLCYIYSFAFENHSTAQITIMTWNFISGFVAVLAYFIMVNIESTKALGESLVHFFRFFPPYNVGEGLINISANYYYNKILFRNTSYWAWEVTGRDITFMAVEAAGYFLVVLVTESEYFLRVLHYFEQLRTGNILTAIKIAAATSGIEVAIDSDVAAEAEKCKNSNPKELALLLHNIDKVYAPSVFGGTAKYAVRSFNLACPAGERFGLLGINGAGKTTTLGILTGGIQPTGGVAFIDGKPLSDPLTRSLVGFCPQTDPLLDLMTGYETIRFFGRIRGMPEEFLDKRVRSLVERVGLSPHAHKPCGTYSGGNKRKLSLAVALVGDPLVLFLDEPSTGMDPMARRNMWDVITDVSEDKSVILTTHSMEECEVLCTRIGIMVSGRLHCLGSSQHLKSKYGVCYELEIRRCVSIDTADCFSLIKDTIESAVLDEEHGTFFRVKTSSSIKLSAAFRLLEKMKEGRKILSYSVSQSTLEQIFIKFAALQEEEKYTPGGDPNVSSQ